MRTIILSLAALLVLAPATFACGGDRTERGLAPANETAVPMDPGDLDETGAERQAQLEAKEQAAEDEGFDDAEGGGKDAKSVYRENEN